MGILGINGVLSSNSSFKAAHFIELDDKHRTLLPFLQSVTGFMVGKVALVSGA